MTTSSALDRQQRRMTTLEPAYVTLNASSPTLDPTGRSLIALTIGPASTGSVQLAAGADGQRLTIVFTAVDGLSTLAFTNGSGRLRLVATVNPTTHRTLSLVFLAATGWWYET